MVEEFGLGDDQPCVDPAAVRRSRLFLQDRLHPVVLGQDDLATTPDVLPPQPRHSGESSAFLMGADDGLHRTDEEIVRVDDEQAVPAQDFPCLVQRAAGAAERRLG